MKSASAPLEIPAAVGKVITSALITGDADDVHGVLLTFTDGTELSIDFYSARIQAEVRHYRWDESGEALSVGREELSPK
jgi:hypothetical protein